MGMTINEALKTRALVDKRISNARSRLCELAAHPNTVKPLVKDQEEVVRKLEQSVSDLEQYWIDLNGAILKANLEHTISVKISNKMTELPLHTALCMRGHGRGRNGTLSQRLDHLNRLKNHLNKHRTNVEAQVTRLVGEHKDFSNLELVEYVDMDEIERQTADIIQLQHDLDVAIENANFTKEVNLGPMPE